MTAEAPHVPIDERKRLHPLTLVYRAITSLPGLLILIIPAIRNPDASTVTYIILSVIYGVFALPWIFLYYHRFRYQITPKEVVIERGVLTRQHRSIPIEHILNVEIEQRALSRPIGLAGVSLETAGGSGADAQIEYVKLEEARAIREVIRKFQRQKKAEAAATGERPVEGPPGTPPPPHEEEHAAIPLHFMTPAAVLQCGAFRFSLVYIALIFGALQFLGFLDADNIERFFRRQPAVMEFFQTVPTWLIVAGGILSAALLGWLTGIMLTFNRFYRFKLYREGDKLFKKHGLLTVSESTIPLKKVQMIIMRANLPMRLFNRCVLELQTMGLDPDQRGRRIAVPLARQEEALELLSVFWGKLPLPEAFNTVSGLHIRRQAIRYTFILLVLVGPIIYFFPDFWWLAFLVLFSLPLAYLQYRHHGYAVIGDMLYARRGVWQQYVWILPLDKVQVFYESQSLFQRRLKLKTLHLDTAGGSSANYPRIMDIPEDLADEMLRALYERFQHLFKTGARTTITRPEQTEAELSRASEAWRDHTPRLIGVAG